MKNLIKRYWWIIPVILILPILINFTLLVPAISPIVGEDTDWLSFWGGYLGAIISAGVAFYILHIQRNDNKKDNINNRKSNKAQNEANRQLQLNIMRYQQEIHWLDKFRLSCLEYSHAFNNNDVVMVTNLMWDNPREAFNILKTLYDRLGTTEAHFSFLCKNNDESSILKSDVFNTHQSFQQLLDDIQWIVLYFTQEAPPTRTWTGFTNFLKFKNYSLTTIMNNIIQENNTNIYNWGDYFHRICITRVKKGIFFESNVKNRMYKYIKEEQERIDNILTENLN